MTTPTERRISVDDVFSLERAVIRAAQDCGGLRALARRTGIDAGYLSRLSTGAKSSPSDQVLKKLGVEREIVYLFVGCAADAAARKRRRK